MHVFSRIFAANCVRFLVFSTPSALNILSGCLNGVISVVCCVSSVISVICCVEFSYHSQRSATFHFRRKLGWYDPSMFLLLNYAADATHCVFPFKFKVFFSESSVSCTFYCTSYQITRSPNADHFLPERGLRCADGSHIAAGHVRSPVWL